jgi:TolA-binding protein
MNGQKNDIGTDEQELLKEFGTSFEALSARHADCPRPELLLASHAGVLDEETARNIATHLGKCTFCQILLRDLTDAELDAARPEEELRVRKRVHSTTTDSEKAEKPSGGIFAVWFRKAVPVAALAGIVLAAVVWVRLHQAAGPVSSPAAVAVQPVKPAAPSVFQWEKLPIKLQASSVLVLRGKPRTAQEKYSAELTAALAYYRDDNFSKAAERLAQVVQAFPGGVEAQLYLGISRLSLQQNAQAIPSLVKAQQLGPEAFRQDATWYLALAQKRSGNLQQSATELGKLCPGKSSYSHRACDGIQELSVQPVEKP